MKPDQTAQITRRRVSTHLKVCGFTAVNYIKCVKKLFLSRNIGKGNKRKSQEKQEEKKMAAISGAWLEALKGEFKKPYYKKLFETVNEEYRTRQIFPPADDIFNAFHLTPLHNVKAVILGQDPYHNVGP